MDEDFSAWAAGAEQPLLRSAYLLTGDLHRAEDLVQEAMVKVALRWRRLREGKPTAYARRIIANDHVSLWRRRGREVPVAAPAVEDGVSTDPEAVLVVRRALDRLTPAQRAVVVLRHFDDLSERETAEVLGIAVGTVKSQNSAALARLRTGAPELLDLVEPAGLGEAAATEARRRRTQRRVVGGAALAVALVLLVGALVVRGDRGAEPPPVAPTTPVSPTVDARGASGPLNPQRVDDLPAAPAGLVPGLPGTIDPPADVPDVTDEPLDAALLAVGSGRVLHLLSPSGDWRRLELPVAETWFTALSPRGTRLVAWAYAGTSALVFDLGAGTQRTVSQPAATAGYETEAWAWIDEERLLLRNANGVWRVDAASDVATRVPYPAPSARWAIDPDGHVVESTYRDRPKGMTDWAGGQPREISLARTGRVESFDVDRDRVAGTALDVPPEGAFEVVVADRRTMTPQRRLVITGPGNYRDGPLSVLALRQDGTVLLHVSVVGPGDRRRVVAWRPDRGDLFVVSALASERDLDRLVFAQQLLREGAP